MAVEWYYMAKSWFGRTRRVGPITEAVFLERIEQGKILPETLVQSSKTKDKWVPMNKVGPAMKRWKELHPAGD